MVFWNRKNKIYPFKRKFIFTDKIFWKLTIFGQINSYKNVKTKHTGISQFFLTIDQFSLFISNYVLKQKKIFAKKKNLPTVKIIDLSRYRYRPITVPLPFSYHRDPWWHSVHHRDTIVPNRSWPLPQGRSGTLVSRWWTIGNASQKW